MMALLKSTSVIVVVVGWCLVFAAPPVQAWGPIGHAMVGNLAWNHLSESAREWVIEVLHLPLQYYKDTDDHDDVWFLSPLGQIASWADEYRPVMQWSTGLHFANVQDDQIEGGCASSPEKRPSCQFDYVRDCPDEFCVSAAVLNYTHQLLQEEEEPTTALRGCGKKNNRTEALMFVTHFMGDLHQPMHVSRKTDRGGNDIPIQFPLLDDDEREWNLHSLWDIALIDVVLERDYYNSRATMQADLETKWWGGGDDFDEEVCWDGWEKSCVIEWTKENWYLTDTKAYRLSDDVSQVEDGSIIDELYYETRIEIVKDRLVVAGERLASTLEYLAKNAPRHG